MATGVSASIDTITSLRANSTAASPPYTFDVQGYRSIGDGGGGTLAYVSTDTTSGAYFSGAISGTTLNVSSVTNGALAIGQSIGGPGIPAGVWITAGSGLSWTISQSLTVSTTTLTADNGGTIFVDQAGQRWHRYGISQGTTPQMFGCACDGVTDDSLSFSNMFLSGSSQFVLGQGTLYLNSAVTTTTSSFAFLVVDSAAVAFGPKGSWVVSGASDVQISGGNWIGPLTSSTQYSVLSGGVSSAFLPLASNLYNNGTYGSAVLNDFAVNSGTTFTLGIPSGDAATLPVTRNMVSQPIVLNPSSSYRYVMSFLDGMLSGNGSNILRVLLFTDSAGTSTPTYYDPTNGTGVAFNFITGFASMRIQIGQTFNANMAINQSCTFDMSKIVIYQAINDLQTVPTGTGGSLEDSGHLMISNCTRARVHGTKWSMSEIACVKLISCTSSELFDNQARFCFGGFTAQNGNANTIKDNFGDFRFYDSAGALTGMNVIRNHLFSSTGENRLTVEYNSCLGAAWGMEIVDTVGANQMYVNHNNIQAEQVGISREGGTRCQANHNNIVLGPIGAIGMEVAGTMTDSEYCNNCIKWTSPVTPFTGNGIAASNSFSQITLDDNTIEAPICIFAISGGGDGYMAIRGGRLTFTIIGTYYNGPGADVGQAIKYLNPNQVVAGSSLPNASVVAQLGTTAETTMRIQGAQIAGTSQYDILVQGFANPVITDNYVVNGPWAHNYNIYWLAPNGTCAAIFHRNEVVGSSLGYAGLNVLGNSSVTASVSTNDNTVNNSKTDYVKPYGAGFSITLNNYKNLVGAVSWTPGAIASGTQVTTTVTISGAKLGSLVVPSLTSSLNGCTMSAYIGTVGTATVVLYNGTGSSQTISASTLVAIASVA